ncbi:hypothetical protein K0M31_002972 [Melipona bicolor]|uniref:Uncharacterized protein n=1 Tax=Melipona bicolor TaxID=60889 RepID=A0AA40G0R0_9HYME|nr:hypothetical protein K0M31_002972 [Melipona bicolor]
MPRQKAGNRTPAVARGLVFVTRQQRIPRAFPVRQSEVAAAVLTCIAHFPGNWILATVSNQEGSAGGNPSAGFRLSNEIPTWWFQPAGRASSSKRTRARRRSASVRSDPASEWGIAFKRMFRGARALWIGGS